jgi:hypothetical protein
MARTSTKKFDCLPALKALGEEHFRSRLDANAHVLDLGCCQFHFDKLPK